MTDQQQRQQRGARDSVTNGNLRQVMRDLLAPVEAELRAISVQLDAKVSVDRFNALRDDVNDLRAAPATNRANVNMWVGVAAVAAVLIVCVAGPIWTAGLAYGFTHVLGWGRGPCLA